MAMVAGSPALRVKHEFRLPRRRAAVPLVSASMRTARELVESGAVMPVAPKEAASLISTGGYELVDVRPAWEREKSFVAGSHHVPLFVEDTDMSPAGLLKKWIHFGYVGWWMGQKLTTVNENFSDQVLEAVAQKKDSKLLVACGEGLRSLLAAEKLHKNGFSNLAWLIGGFGGAESSDFPKVEGSTELKYASFGGFAQYFVQIILFFQGFSDKSS